MPESSQYTRLADDSAKDGIKKWWLYRLTSLERKLIIFSTISVIVIFSLSIALAKCQAKVAPTTTTTVVPTNATTPSEAPTNATTPSEAPTTVTTSTVAPTTTTTVVPTNATTPSEAPTNATTPSEAPTITTTPSAAPTNTATPAEPPINATTVSTKTVPPSKTKDSKLPNTHDVLVVVTFELKSVASCHWLQRTLDFGNFCSTCKSGNARLSRQFQKQLRRGALFAFNSVLFFIDKKRLQNINTPIPPPPV
ncbi:hypothetical protein CBL_07141 [Carabus blaptoides fortunei]